MWTPETLFELFFDEEVTTFICEMTNTYAIENQACNWAILTPGELRCFIGIIILSGYCKLPSYSMFWEEALDVQHPLVKNAMNRTRFKEILRYTHFCDNANINPGDKCGKVRPLL